MSILLFTLALGVVVGTARAEYGSCRAEGLCCAGADGECVAQTAAPDADRVWRGLEAVEPCYCDKGCVDVGDCCPDYKEFCSGNTLDSLHFSRS